VGSTVVAVLGLLLLLITTGPRPPITPLRRLVGTRSTRSRTTIPNIQMAITSRNLADMTVVVAVVAVVALGMMRSTPPMGAGRVI
jgi:hypothetical protein